MLLLLSLLCTQLRLELLLLFKLSSVLANFAVFALLAM